MGKEIQTKEQNTTAVVQESKQPTPAERFTNSVIANFSSNNGDIQITNYMQKLIQNYFIKLDSVLKDLEIKRMKKGENYRDDLPYKWENVNMNKLAVDVIAFSSIGLDPVQPNHVSLIPYKNASTNKFDIGFLPGYSGMEIKAKKYGLDVPDVFISELVYSTDVFRQVKKDINNKVESYHFEITDSFNRGEIVGGFYYHIYKTFPEKNKLRVFSMADIEKRKPSYASPEFWGGEKDVWKDGKKVGKEKIEGWLDEMALKTIKRACYGSITIDSSKIDDAYTSTMKSESEMSGIKIENEILLEANKEELIFQDAEIVEETQEEIKELNTPEVPNQTLSPDLFEEGNPEGTPPF